MTPAELVREWIKRFNAADIDGLAELYAPYAAPGWLWQMPVLPR